MRRRYKGTIADYVAGQIHNAFQDEQPDDLLWRLEQLYTLGIIRELAVAANPIDETKLSWSKRRYAHSDRRNLIIRLQRDYRGWLARDMTARAGVAE